MDMCGECRNEYMQHLPVHPLPPVLSFECELRNGGQVDGGS